MHDIMRVRQEFFQAEVDYLDGENLYLITIVISPILEINVLCVNNA